VDVPLDVIDDKLYAEPKDADRLAELAGSLGVESSVQRLQTAIRKALD
jgi:hypothetical protein